MSNETVKKWLYFQNIDDPALLDVIKSTSKEDLENIVCFLFKVHYKLKQTDRQQFTEWTMDNTMMHISQLLHAQLQEGPPPPLSPPITQAEESMTPAQSQVPSAPVEIQTASIPSPSADLASPVAESRSGQGDAVAKPALTQAPTAVSSSTVEQLMTVATVEHQSEEADNENRLSDSEMDELFEDEDVDTSGLPSDLSNFVL